MSKFWSNMLYAFIVYILLYGIVIGYMHISAKASRDYCDQIKIGMTQKVLEQTAKQNNLYTELTSLTNKEEKLLFVKTELDSEAVCQAHIVSGILKKKNFVQHFL